MEHHENIVIWNWSKNLPWWLLASIEEPRKIGLSFTGCRKHCLDGFSQGILLLHFPSQSVTKPHPANNGHGTGDWNLTLGTAEHLTLKMLASHPCANGDSLQLLLVRVFRHLRTGKAWRLGLEQMLPRSEEPVIKSSIGVQTRSRTRIVSTQYKVWPSMGYRVLQNIMSVLEEGKNGLWWIQCGSLDFRAKGSGSVFLNIYQQAKAIPRSSIGGTRLPHCLKKVP